MSDLLEIMELGLTTRLGLVINRREGKISIFKPELMKIIFLITYILFRIQGYRVQSTDIGGWNLNIHHSFPEGRFYTGKRKKNLLVVFH